MSEPLGIDLSALQTFLQGVIPDIGAELSASLVHGGRSNLTYDVTDGRTHWVIRRPPLGLVAPSANDLGREHRVTAALGRSRVPVPTAIAYCEDPTVIGAPFSVSSFVVGDVIRTPNDAAGLTADELTGCGAALIETLAALHDLDPAEVGLEGLGRPEGYMARQLGRWRSQWEIVRTRDLPDLGRLAQQVEASLPATGQHALVHGDYRIDNLLFVSRDPTKVAAVVDWEMATLGDPLADLGLLLVYQDPICAPLIGAMVPMAGQPAFPGPDALVERYADARDREVAGIEAYVAFGYLKLAVVAEGIHRRFVDGDTVGEGFDTVGSAVPALVAAGLARLRARSSW